MNEENEEVLENDVPETSEENLEEVNIDTSEDVETNQEPVEETETNSEEDIERLVEERANKMFEEKVKDRLARDRASQERKFNKQLAKYKYLENVMSAGLSNEEESVEGLDEVINRASNFYREQGVNIPEFNEGYSERDEKILAKADAQEIIELGRDEMEAEANRIANIPANERTIREKTIFDTVCKELIALQDIDDMKSKGYKTDVLDTKEFKEFREQFNVNTPISKIYEMYNKVNGQVIEQPKSPGSAKSTSQTNEIKDYYTPDEARQFTEEELDKNPRLMEAIERSMLKWGKSN